VVSPVVTLKSGRINFKICSRFYGACCIIALRALFSTDHVFSVKWGIYRNDGFNSRWKLSQINSRCRTNENLGSFDQNLP